MKIKTKRNETWKKKALSYTFKQFGAFIIDNKFWLKELALQYELIQSVYEICQTFVHRFLIAPLQSVLTKALPWPYLILKNTGSINFAWRNWLSTVLNCLKPQVLECFFIRGWFANRIKFDVYHKLGLVGRTVANVTNQYNLPTAVKRSSLTGK